MSRHLKRVPLDFAWPLKQIWSGFLNPYADLAAECPDCQNGFDRAGGRPDANAALFSEQWYANAPFDPIAYGAEPLSPDSPAIWNFANDNVDRDPGFYMTSSEKAARHTHLQKIGDDLMEIHRTMTTAELKAALDRPTADLENLESPGVVELESFRKPAIAREAARLHALWRGRWCHHLIQADVDALVKADRLPDFTRRPRTPEQVKQLEVQAAAGLPSYWLAEPNGYHPTATEVNAWSLSGTGHDGINHHVCVEARCLREAVPCVCCRCAGSGLVYPTPEIKQQHDDWLETSPPVGDGYQLWEDVSEGSPVSPVFASLDELCAWCADHATTFAHFRATAVEWREMLDGGLVHHQEGNKIFL